MEGVPLEVAIGKARAWKEGKLRLPALKGSPGWFRQVSASNAEKTMLLEDLLKLPLGTHVQGEIGAAATSTFGTIERFADGSHFIRWEDGYSTVALGKVPAFDQYIAAHVHGAKDRSIHRGTGDGAGQQIEPVCSRQWQSARGGADERMRGVHRA